MEFIKQIERLHLLNKLVWEQRTGTPEELAKRIGVSRRQLYAYLEYLKDYGLEIIFDRKLNSFSYGNQQIAEIIFKFEILDSGSSKNIYGGNKLKNFIPCCFYARSEAKLAS
jgi:transcriptional antiterminator